MLYNHEIDNSTLIQFIILYALNKANELVAYGDLLNLVLENCNIRYTDFQLSLDNLVNTKHAAQKKKKKPTMAPRRNSTSTCSI